MQASFSLAPLLIPAITSVLCITFSVCSVIALCVAGASVNLYGDGIVDAIVLQCDCIQRGRDYLKRTEGL